MSDHHHSTVIHQVCPNSVLLVEFEKMHMRNKEGTLDAWFVIVMKKQSPGLHFVALMISHRRVGGLKS